MRKVFMTLGALCTLSLALATCANADPNDFGGPSLGSIIASDGVFVDGMGPVAGSAWRQGSDGAFVDDNGAAYAAAAANPLLTHAIEVDSNNLHIPIPRYGEVYTIEYLGGYARLLPGDELHMNLESGGDIDTGIVAGGNTTFFYPARSPFNFFVNNQAFDDFETGGSGNWYSDDSLNGNPGGTDHLGFAYNKHFRVFEVGNGNPFMTTYYIGVEDSPKRLSDRDFNDFVFKVSPGLMPEPSFYQMGVLVLGGGLLLLRRRRK